MPAEKGDSRHDSRLESRPVEKGDLRHAQEDGSRYD